MKPSHKCCDPWDDAKESGTDNEGYGPLLRADDNSGRAVIGSDLPPISFCPWCGSKIVSNTICDGKVVGTSA